MLLFDIPRAWHSALKHVMSIACKQEVSPSDGIRIYGGSFLPTGILFMKKTYKNPIGKYLMDQEVCELAVRLKDLDSLSQLPDFTLGKMYYDFYKDNLMDTGPDMDFREHLDADKKRPNRPYAKQNYNKNEKVNRFFEQISYQHDLMHVIGNHPFEIEGEATVHAMLIPHIRIPAPKLIAFVLMISQAWVKKDIRFIGKVYKAYRQGKNAKNLFMVDWVQYLDKDIDKIRQEFNINI